MSELAEGDQTIFEGIGEQDGLWPGDVGTLLALSGRAAWICMKTGRKTGTICLVLAEDLTEYAPEEATSP